jgi:hypothetical protein
MTLSKILEAEKGFRKTSPFHSDVQPAVTR